MNDSNNKSQESEKISVIILAGGKSSRMRKPKVWLPVVEQTTFLEHTLRLFSSAGFSNQVVVINSEFCAGEWGHHLMSIPTSVQIVRNNKPEAGRLHSILLGLNQLENNGFVFIHNVDNPLVKKESLLTLLHSRSGDMVCIPKFENRNGHPILCETMLLKNKIEAARPTDTLKEVLATIPKKIVPVNDPGILVNINTQEDYLIMQNGLVA